AQAVLSPSGIYIVGAALAGALLGILIPLSLSPRTSGGRQALPGSEVIVVVPVLVAVCIGFVFAFEATLAAEILGALAAGVLFGLFVPSPATRR
ncbi:MAG TPA: hypothetical protein VL972_05680, partial [Solirubrobacteraceae bacterium]|nr:hypothetical protein [Solirubrobacteraceae bacterium]